MANNNIYREFPVELSANGSHIVNFLADTVQVLSADGSFDIKVGSNPRTNFRAGIILDTREFEDFSSVQFFDTSGNANSLVVAFSNGSIKDSRLTVSGNVSIQNASGDQLETIEHKATTIETAAKATITEGAAAAVIMAADTDRRVVFLQNLSLTDSVYIGDSNVSQTTGRGYALAPGETLVLGSEAGGFTGAIYAHCDNADSQDVDIGFMVISE